MIFALELTLRKAHISATLWKRIQLVSIELEWTWFFDENVEFCEKKNSSDTSIFRSLCFKIITKANKMSFDYFLHQVGWVKVFKWQILITVTTVFSKRVYFLWSGWRTKKAWFSFYPYEIERCFFWHVEKNRCFAQNCLSMTRVIMICCFKNASTVLVFFLLELLFRLVLFTIWWISKSWEMRFFLPG